MLATMLMNLVLNPVLPPIVIVDSDMQKRNLRQGPTLFNW